MPRRRLLYALVLAGGRGERLRPLTENVPKPMVPVNGRPLLEYHVQWLRAGGVTDVVFLCGHLSEVVETHFGDGSAFGFRAHYSVEEEPLGRGGAFRLGAGHLPPDEEFAIGTNGDVLTEQPLPPLVAAHRRRAAAATIMLTPLVSPYGVVRTTRGGWVQRFQEKPVLPHWINAGVYVLGWEFFRRLPAVGDHEDTTFPALASEGKLLAFRSSAYWKSVDSMKDLSEVRARLTRA